jgi:hypothetical protein
MIRPNHSRGFTLLLLVVVVVGAYLAIDLARRGVGAPARVLPHNTLARMQNIEASLTSYVALAGRLPCPAAGTAGTGRAVPEATTDNCTNRDGVVPWATLGLSREDAYDGWGRLISYRVFDGTYGLTKDGGASMIDCDRLGTTADVRPTDHQCETGSPRTQDSKFVTGKGLSLTENGAPVSQVAFALVSHGPSGYGAFLDGGQRMQMPAIGSSELANTSDFGGFVISNASQPSIAPSDPAHYDDVVRYMQIESLIRSAGRGPRDWP